MVFRRMIFWDSCMTYRESEVAEYRGGKKFSCNNLHGVLFFKVLGLWDKGLRCVPSIKVIKECVRK